MDLAVRQALFRVVETEPLANTLGMKLVDLDTGYSFVEMAYIPSVMDNIYHRAHGGAIFALIDEAFETASQTDGTIAVALNVNVSYLASPDAGDLLRAEAKEVNRSRKIANYDIKVTDQNNRLIATCQAIAYRTGKQIPFI